MPINTREISSDRSSFNPIDNVQGSKDNLNLEVITESSSSEVRPDEVTDSERQELKPRKKGVIVFDEDLKKNRYYNGTDWLTFPFTQGGGVNGITISQQVPRYNDLLNGTATGQLAYVEESQGTSWLPSTLGGTYYPRGFYLWDGSEWISDRNAISNQLELNSEAILELQNEVTDLGNDIESTQVSSDPNNSATIGSDGLIFVGSNNTRILPIGGSKRQVVVKNSSTLNDYSWRSSFKDYLISVEYTGQRFSTPQGDVLEATIDGGIVYRYIRNELNQKGYPLEDSFYNDFTGSTLSNLIATRK